MVLVPHVTRYFLLFPTSFAFRCSWWTLVHIFVNFTCAQDIHFTSITSSLLHSLLRPMHKQVSMRQYHNLNSARPSSSSVGNGAPSSFLLGRNRVNSVGSGSASNNSSHHPKQAFGVGSNPRGESAGASSGGGVKAASIVEAAPMSADGIVFAQLRGDANSLVVYRSRAAREALPERLNLDRRKLTQCPILENEEVRKLTGSGRKGLLSVTLLAPLYIFGNCAN